NGLEFLVQRELLDERLAQLHVVVNDQDLANIDRQRSPLGAVAMHAKMSIRGEKSKLELTLIRSLRLTGCNETATPSHIPVAPSRAEAARTPQPGCAARRGPANCRRARTIGHSRQQ